MSDRRIKTIQTDFFQSLEFPANNFLASTPGLNVEKIICDNFIVIEGRQAHNFTCEYFIHAEDLQRQRIKLIMRDKPSDLQDAINTAIEELAEEDNEILDIQRDDTILENGNKFYCACLIYQPSETPSSGLKVKIFERDNVTDLEKASNTFLSGGSIVISSIGVLRNDVFLANGNKIYLCTIPYTELD